MLPLSFLLIGPLLVHAAQYCALKPPKGTSASTEGGIQHGGTSTGDAADGSDVIASAWYPGWLAADFPPASLSWDKYNAMTFAFATTTPDVNTLALDDASLQALPQFVTAAQSNGVTALLSIGGWTGSMYFSTAVATAENRTAFVTAVLGLVSKYNLDGIDFDWEYPGQTTGLSCNKESPDDSANFLLFLQELRNSSAGKDLVLTAAVGLTPFHGPDGTPLDDVSDFADVLNRIAIMDYDVFGSWSTTVGPNAPLNDTCAPTADQEGSAVSAVNAWTSANFPIALGVASYGHSFRVEPTNAVTGKSSLTLYPNYDKSNQPVGSADTPGDATSVDPCGGTGGQEVSGIFTFGGLISTGFLDSNGTAADADEIFSVFDQCSQTPFVYNSTSQVMVSYDDADSFAAKGRFINARGLIGFAMWDVTGDQNDILLDSLHQAMSIQSVCD